MHETYFSAKPLGKARRRVVTVYDMIHELFMPNAKLAIAAKRAAVKRADHIICISENTRQDLVRLHDIDPARTSVVHLGYSLTAEADSAQDGLRGQRPTLLYVGLRGGYKNFSTLLQAYSSSPVLREFELIAFGGPRCAATSRKKSIGWGSATRCVSSQAPTANSRHITRRPPRSSAPQNTKDSGFHPSKP